MQKLVLATGTAGKMRDLAGTPGIYSARYAGDNRGAGRSSGAHFHGGLVYFRHADDLMR